MAADVVDIVAAAIVGAVVHALERRGAVARGELPRLANLGAARVRDIVRGHERGREQAAELTIRFAAVGARRAGDGARADLLARKAAEDADQVHTIARVALVGGDEVVQPVLGPGRDHVGLVHAVRLGGRVGAPARSDEDAVVPVRGVHGHLLVAVALHANVLAQGHVEDDVRIVVLEVDDEVPAVRGEGAALGLDVEADRVAGRAVEAHVEDAVLLCREEAGVRPRRFCNKVGRVDLVHRAADGDRAARRSQLAHGHRAPLVERHVPVEAQEGLVQVGGRAPALRDLARAAQLDLMGALVDACDQGAEAGDALGLDARGRAAHVGEGRRIVKGQGARREVVLRGRRGDDDRIREARHVDDGDRLHRVRAEGAAVGGAASAHPVLVFEVHVPLGPALPHGVVVAALEREPGWDIRRGVFGLLEALVHPAAHGRLVLELVRKVGAAKQVAAERLAFGGRVEGVVDLVRVRRAAVGDDSGQGEGCGIVRVVQHTRKGQAVRTRGESELQREERRLDTRGGHDGAVHGDAEHGCVAARAGPAAVIHVLVDARRHLAVRVEVGADVQRANLCETRDRKGVSTR